MLNISKTSVIIIMVVLILNLSLVSIGAQEIDIGEMDKMIKDKKEEIENLKSEVKSYEKKIVEQKNKAASLASELAILENQLAKIKLDIKTTGLEIEKTNLEIKNIEEQIEIKKGEIKKQKNEISQFIQIIHRYDEQSYLEILALNESFSDFFNQLEYLEEIGERLKGIMDELMVSKRDLELTQKELKTKESEFEDFKLNLEIEKNNLNEKTDTKEILLSETKSTEKGFQALLWQAKQEQAQIDNEIQSLEIKLREALEKTEQEDGLASFSSDLNWPVDPSRGISSYFHDPDYPFRYIFEHPAIDIRAYQGTPVKAAASGYVARAKDAGYGYNYIMLIHNNGLSTVYGHVSRIDVAENTYITRGQVIGLSGGMPGTPGAGRLSTGSHLHFEVRLNGIPVNPLDYLP